MNILHLTIKKKFFDMIASGEKLEEYRSIKSYWIARLISKSGLKSEGYKESDLTPIVLDFIKSFPENVRQICKKFDAVEFKNGYNKNSPCMIVEFKGLDIGEARPEWSDNWKGDVFRIKLGKILNITNND
jgi:hypothetical protein